MNNIIKAEEYSKKSYKKFQDSSNRKKTKRVKHKPTKRQRIYINSVSLEQMNPMITTEHDIDTANEWAVTGRWNGNSSITVDYDNTWEKRGKWDFKSCKITSREPFMFKYII